jgi:hypothetical protein
LGAFAPAARRPKLTPARVGHARELYAETGEDGKRRHTVAEIASLLGGVSRTTIYCVLDPDEVTGTACRSVVPCLSSRVPYVACRERAHLGHSWGYLAITWPVGLAGQASKSGGDPGSRPHHRIPVELLSGKG